jgi:hypothetical protein
MDDNDVVTATDGEIQAVSDIDLHDREMVKSSPQY